MAIEERHRLDGSKAGAQTGEGSGRAVTDREKFRWAMEAEGFVNYDQEWRHYTFNVSNPLRFDRPIR